MLAKNFNIGEVKMHSYLTAVFFIFGTVFGSFFNVVGIRLPKGNFLQEKRSHCPHCDRTLRAYELIPVVSYLIQRGKCRGCKKKISPMYPLIEFGTGLSFALACIRFGLTAELVFILAFICCCFIVIVTDSYYKIISNTVLLIFLPVFVLWRVHFPYVPWYTHLTGGIIGFLLLFVIILVSKGGMGVGDMKYFGLLGFVFGWQQLFLLFLLATGYGAVINLVLLFLGKITRKSKIPFGPYISLAALTVLFYGKQIIEWYVGLYW